MVLRKIFLTLSIIRNVLIIFYLFFYSTRRIFFPLYYCLSLSHQVKWGILFKYIDMYIYMFSKKKNKKMTVKSCYYVGTSILKICKQKYIRMLLLYFPIYIYKSNRIYSSSSAFSVLTIRPSLLCQVWPFEFLMRALSYTYFLTLSCNTYFFIKPLFAFIVSISNSWIWPRITC